MGRLDKGFRLSKIEQRKRAAATILEFVGKEGRWCYFGQSNHDANREHGYPSKDKPQPERREKVVAVLTRCKASLINRWLVRTKETPQLNHLHLSDDERTGHLPKLIDDMIARLSRPKLPGQDSDAIASPAAVEHGKLRQKQGYSAAMLIHESRIFEVTIFGILHENLSMLDFNLLLPDVMIIADEKDAQLTQTVDAFARAGPQSTAA